MENQRYTLSGIISSDTSVATTEGWATNNIQSLQDMVEQQKLMAEYQRRFQQSQSGVGQGGLRNSVFTGVSQAPAKEPEFDLSDFAGAKMHPCKTCKWVDWKDSETEGGASRCKRPTGKSQTSPLTGETFDLFHNYVAMDERRARGQNDCGMQGRFWEEAPPAPPTLGEIVASWWNNDLSRLWSWASRRPRATADSSPGSAESRDS